MRLGHYASFTIDPPPTRMDTSTRPAVFVARGLAKIYRMGEVEVHALRGIDLDIYSGEFVVLLGPSGSGKSTLLNILGGLDVPSGGTAMWHDHDQFYNLIPSLTARENVALVTEMSVNPMTPEEALALVGLGDRLDHYPSQLSGGEQQRVAIARAVAKRPDVLLCDEPTGALDYPTGKLVLEVIAHINATLGTTAVVITHNAPIAKIADRVMRLADGRIASVEVNTARRSPAEISW
jgi:putative ABC transport system ATP-binding protein